MYRHLRIHNIFLKVENDRRTLDEYIMGLIHIENKNQLRDLGGAELGGRNQWLRLGSRNQWLGCTGMKFVKYFIKS